MKAIRIYLFVILFSLLNNSVFSQTDTNVLHLLEIAKEHTNFQLFETKLDSFIETFPKERTVGQLSFYKPRDAFRLFGVGFASYTTKFELIKEVDKSTYSSESYKLTLLLDAADLSIFYVHLVETNGFRGDYERDVFFDFDSTQFEHYFARHDSLFNTTTPRDFVNPPFINKNYYGPMCGYHDSEQYNEMIKFVDQNRRDVFVFWLKSFNLENKVYGAQGLYFLQKKGVELTDEEKQLMDAIRSIRIAKVKTDLNQQFIGVLLSENRLDREFEEYARSKR